MKTINKQKFLAELGRLLTFMYEEDRQTALAMYTRIFDMAEDEQAVLQFLVSPTRQAVVLARTYDSAQRKLQAHSQHREEWQQQDPGETPAFVLAIEQLEKEALSLGVTAQEEEDVNQFSLFDEASDEEQAEAADVSLSDSPAPSDSGADEDGLEPLPDIDDTDDSQEPLTVGAAIAAGAAAAQAGEAVSEPESGEVSEAAEESAEAEEAGPAEADEGTETDGQAEADEAVPSPEAEEAADEGEAAGAAEAGSDGNTEADAVDAFLADFSIKEDSAEAPVPAADTKLPDAPAAGGEEFPSGDAAAAEDEPMPELDELDEPDNAAAPARTVRKPRVALLLLYIIFAVPIGLFAVYYLLVPTALSLAIAVFGAASGVAALLTAFSFDMLANSLVVFGGALILLALAVLFAWLFVWFIVKVIGGLIRGLRSLGRKWCYKEVPADE